MAPRTAVWLANNRRIVQSTQNRVTLASSCPKNGEMVREGFANCQHFGQCRSAVAVYHSAYIWPGYGAQTFKVLKAERSNRVITGEVDSNY